jgi:predicted alpha/beta superfamily hydrolase
MHSLSCFLKQLVIIATFLLLSCGNTLKEKETLKTIHTTYTSTFVKDSFDIYVSLPANYNSGNQTFPVIFYMDANLKSGKKLRSVINEFTNNNQPINAVFVGVGHTGSYRILRRRDFISPDIDSSLTNTDKNYGHSDNFYEFLKNELVPFVEKNYKVNQNRSLIGHSLGGLFCVYSLFKKDRLFTNYVALSPSLWVDRRRIYEFEKQYRKDSTSLHANLYLCSGTKETLNYILNGNRDMKSYLEKQSYTGLNLHYYEFEGETHNSEVPIALKEILPKLDD